MNRKILAAAALAAVLAGCASSLSSSPPNWYADGKAWAIAAGKAQGNAKLIGYTPNQYCNYVLGLGQLKVVGIALTPGDPAGPLTPQAMSQWVAGCTAGTR